MTEKITERKEGEECNQMEKVVGGKEMKTEQVREEQWGIKKRDQRRGRRWGVA